MSTYLKKANLLLVLVLVISLCLPGNAKAASKNSDLDRASFSKSSPAKNESLDPSGVTLKWTSTSNVFQYRYCYYSYDAGVNNVCNISSKDTWLSNGTSTSVQLPALVPGKTYYWQVGAKLNDSSFIYADGALSSKWSFTVKSGIAEIGVYDDTDSRWIYSGTWTASTGASVAYKGTIHTTSTVGNYAEIKFNGAAFILTLRTKADRGWINVIVDGNKVATIDAYSASPFWQVTWRSPFFTSGTHTVHFKHAGDGSFIDIDAIQIIGPPAQSGIYDDTHGNWIYHGTWSASVNDLAYNKTIHTTSIVGNSAELIFNGTKFILTYRKKSDRGSINVYVDEEFVETIVATSSTSPWQVAWMSPTYTAGVHTVRFEHAGEGTFIDIDAIQIIGTPVKSGIYDDTDKRWFYSGAWTASASDPAYNKTIHTTRTVGNSAELVFNGTKFILTYRQRSDRGSINVYVDEEFVETIVATSTTPDWQVAWSSPTYTAGNHTVRFEHAGEGTFIDIDAIQIIGTPVQPGIYDDTHGRWFYSGAWTASANDLAYKKTIHTTSTVGNSAELSFYGINFILTYRGKFDRGSINVYVDEEFVETIVATSTTPDWQVAWSSPTYTAGNHTVRFEHAGEGTFIDIDAIEIVGP